MATVNGRLRHVDSKPQKTLKSRRLPPSEFAGRSGRVRDAAADPVRFGVAAGQVRGASGPHGVHHRRCRRRVRTSRTPRRNGRNRGDTPLRHRTPRGGKTEKRKRYDGLWRAHDRTIAKRSYAHRSAVGVFLPVVPHLRRRRCWAGVSLRTHDTTKYARARRSFTHEHCNNNV